ncbi:hypothetical protein V6U81_13385 [Micromonospora sp. CPCC 205711]|uniref:hypothetical protein n=1 Tax=Micromonospora sp. CPCC 205547 TaxID=3122400 RepID=UPI002FF1C5A5
MRTAKLAETGWWARLLLLACTLLGLAAMHTIGHGAHAEGAHPMAHGTHADGAYPFVYGAHADQAYPLAHGAHADEAHLVGRGAHAEGAAAVGGCAGDHCAGAVASPAGDAGGHPHLWTVCLAVIGALAVTLLLAALLLGWTRPAVGDRGPSRPSPGPRAPPGRPLGLRLATVSVLRT